MKEVTSPSSVFNVRHGHVVTLDEEHGKSDMLSNSSDDDSSGDEIIEIDPAWRSKIGFADWVDFLDEKKSTWSRAQIVEENQPEFKFKILREGELDYHAEWVGIFSDRIAPHNTKTRAAQKKATKISEATQGWR